MSFKIFSLWLIIVSLILFSLFWQSEGELGLLSLFLVILLLSAPIAAVATIVYKWISDAKSKIGSGEQQIGNASQTGMNTSFNFTKTLVIFLLGAAALFIHWLLYFVLYYVIQKSIEVFVKKIKNQNIVWFVGGVIWTLLCYFVFKYGFILIYDLLRAFPNPLLGEGLRNLPYLFSRDQFLVFFVPVIFYEWYKIRRKNNNETHREISLLWFILIPSIILLIWFYIFSLSASGEEIGWGILELMASVPLGILFSSVWIFSREYRESRKSKLKIKDNEHIDTPTTILPKQHFYPVLILILTVLAFLIFLAVQIFLY